MAIELSSAFFPVLGTVVQCAHLQILLCLRGCWPWLAVINILGEGKESRIAVVVAAEEALLVILKSISHIA